MATAVTVIPGPNGATQYPHPTGAWAKDVSIAFSGNYKQDGTESTVTAAQLGVNRILDVIPHNSMLLPTNDATANSYGLTVASGSVVFSVYEPAASGDPSAEKTDNEAFAAGQAVRVTVVWL